MACVGTRYAIVNANTCVVSQPNCEAAIRSFIASKMSAGDAARLTPTAAIVWQDHGDV